MQRLCRSGSKPRIGAGSKKSPRLVAAAAPSGLDAGPHEALGSPPQSYPPGGASPGAVPGHCPPGAISNDAATAGAYFGNGPAEASFGGATPVSAWMASKLSLWGSREGAGDNISAQCSVSLDRFR